MSSRPSTRPFKIGKRCNRRNEKRHNRQKRTITQPADCEQFTANEKRKRRASGPTTEWSMDDSQRESSGEVKEECF
ncbi:hypothetical protein [Haladaptatus halobius]|uniref:hypothetical protein n=1 Tax=Haladaptatus halobius TaxID=2884875 RepID=UPI001D0AFF82|nr:hypothetical protein [Haladaptatus halobius]